MSESSGIPSSRTREGCASCIPRSALPLACLCKGLDLKNKKEIGGAVTLLSGVQPLLAALRRCRCELEAALPSLKEACEFALIQFEHFESHHASHVHQM